MAKSIGIIAEDESDANSAKILIHRIAKNEKIGIKRKLGNGCGKLARKCSSWSKELHDRGCTTLVIIHDLDRNNLKDLSNKIQALINPCPIKKNLICIPIEEMEAWFLSDSNAIKQVFNLRKLPNEIHLPERIKSPKEALGHIVDKYSGSEKYYLNTKHNEILAQHLSLKSVTSKCPSFVPFHNFIKLHFNS